MIKILVKNIDKSKFTIYGVSIMLFSMITFVIRTLVDINGLVDLGAGEENVKIVFTFYYIIIVATGFMFILYSLRFYIRSRIKDYSLFIILGTSRKKVLLLMMLEFSAIYFLSTVLGIIIGIFITKTISAIFIFNNIKAYLEWDILLDNTVYSLKTSFLLFIISYSAGFISAMKKNLSNTMTTSLKREYPYRFMCIFVLAGLALCMIAIKLLKAPTFASIMISLLLFLAGIYIILTFGLSVIIWMYKKIFKRAFLKNILNLNDLIYRYKTNKTLLFNAFTLNIVIIFFSGGVIITSYQSGSNSMLVLRISSYFMALFTIVCSMCILFLKQLNDTSYKIKNLTILKYLGMDIKGRKKYAIFNFRALLIAPLILSDIIVWTYIIAE